MPFTDPLQAAAAQFAQWRDNKATLGQRTPHALRQQAVQLTKQYSVSKVVSTLGLSGSVIKQWQRSAEQGSEPADTPNASFVTLPTIHHETINKGPSVSLNFDNAGTITLSPDLPIEILTRVLQACRGL